MLFKQWIDHDNFRLIELEPPWFDDEKIISSWGYPVELFIVEEEDESNIIASPEDIGWFDEGEDSEDLFELKIAQINMILEEYDGLLEIQIEEDCFDLDESVIPVYVDGKIIISYVEEEEEED